MRRNTLLEGAENALTLSPRLFSLQNHGQTSLAIHRKTSDGVSMSEEKLIISTAASREEASRIANALVEESLAACVNLTGPIDSVYRWRGKVENAQEFLLLIKTTSSKSANTIARLRELHSYEVPEAIALDIEDGSAEYLRWIRESV